MGDKSLVLAVWIIRLGIFSGMVYCLFGSSAKAAFAPGASNLLPNLPDRRGGPFVEFVFTGDKLMRVALLRN
jgi:hypothetical protein